MTSRRFRARAAALLAAGLLALAGCGRGKPPVDPAAHAQALIEDGNQAYKLGDYRLAARRYSAAAVANRNDPAAYYGMGMALSKLGRDDDARKAYARAQELAKQQSK